MKKYILLLMVGCSNGGRHYIEKCSPKNAFVNQTNYSIDINATTPQGIDVDRSKTIRIFHNLRW